MQRVRKRRSTSAARVLTSSSKVKNTARFKVKVEPEPADEVTCSTDHDVTRHQSSTAAEVSAKCESPDDTLLPDTTTENFDDVITCQSVSNRVAVDAAAADNHGVVVPQLQQQQPAVPAYNDVGGPYQHQYVNYVHEAAPPYCRQDQPASLAAGRYYDDIDDVLSVMASVAGVTHHLNVPNY